MSGEAQGSKYVETKSGPTYVRDGKAFVRDKAHPGELVQFEPHEADAALANPDYAPATAEDVANADIKAANSTLGAKAKTFAESGASAFIDAAQAPIALPLRAGAAALGKEDPLKNIHGRATTENLATLFGDIKEGLFGGQTGEAYGRQYAENARERAEANPGTALAGNIAGTLAAAGIGGGPGALAEGAGAAIGRGALAKAVQGGVEGAFFGQAQAGEEAYLHNVPLSAEKLIASMGWGAVLGGGVSLAAHGVGSLLRRGSRGATPIDGPRLPGELPEAAELAARDGLETGALDVAEQAAQGGAKGKISSALREFADERTAKALGARGSTLKKLGRTAEKAYQTMRDVADTVRGIKLDDGEQVFRALDTQEALAERVALAKEQTGSKLSAFREKADNVFEAHPEIAPRAEAIADRIAREVVQPLESHPLSAIAQQAKPIRQVVDDIRALGEKSKLAANDNSKAIGLQDLTRLRQGLDDQIYQVKQGVNLPQQGAAPALKDLERARMILEEQIEAASDKAATFFDKAEGQSYKQLKTQWRHLHLADEIAGSAQLQDLGNRVVSPSDYGAGILGAAMGGGPLGAIASSVAHKAVREHSSAVLAVLADKLANSLDGKIEKGLGAFFNESTKRASSAVSGLDKVAAAVPLKRMATPTAVEAFQGKSKDLQGAYKKRVAEITDATRDGGAGVRGSTIRAMGGAAQAMPQLTAAATATATRGAQYLESQLPAGTQAPTMLQPSRSFTPSDLAIREFAQKWSAVSNPLSVIDDLRRGTVTHAQIDALKNVYPELYNQVRVKALEKVREIDQSGDRMPLNDRLQLDLFLDLGGAGEPTLAPGFIDRMTAAQAAVASQQGQSRPPSSNSQLNNIGKSRASGAQAALSERF